LTRLALRPVPLRTIILGASAGASSQVFGIDFLVEADQDRLARANRGGSKVARRTEHRGDHFVHGCRAFLDVKLGHLRTFRDDDFVGFFSQRLSVIAAELLFSGIRLLAGGEFVLRKEPLRFGATRSVAAVVVPVDGLGHDGCHSYWIRKVVIRWVGRVKSTHEPLKFCHACPPFGLRKPRAAAIIWADHLYRIRQRISSGRPDRRERR